MKKHGNVNVITSWKQRAGQLETEIHALYLAYRDPRVVWYAKVISIAIVAYALSPIDLIPDFIPILGYADDLIIVTAGVFLIRKIIPKEVMLDCRERAKCESINSKAKWVAALIIILLWLLVIYLVVKFIWKLLVK